MIRFLDLTGEDCLFLGSIFLGLFLIWVGLTYKEDSGVITHSSGQAVYLQGKACVVNYQPVEDMAIQMGWCLDQRLEDE